MWVYIQFKFDLQSRERIIYFYIFSARYQGKSAVLSSAPQNAKPRKFGGSWGTKRLNTRFLLPSLLYGIQRRAESKMYINFIIRRR